MVCCWLRSATPTRWCFSNRPGSIARREEVEDDGAALPLDRCFVLREGTDITLVTWGAMTKETLAAADRLEAEGVSAEIIDVATLKARPASWRRCGGH